MVSDGIFRCYKVLEENRRNMQCIWIQWPLLFPIHENRTQSRNLLYHTVFTCFAYFSPPLCPFFKSVMPLTGTRPLTLLLSDTAETQTLPRSSSVAAGLERNGRTRVQAIFSHSAGDNNTLLSFNEGDIITLLVPEARDGWHYGESEKTRMWVTQWNYLDTVHWKHVYLNRKPV